MGIDATLTDETGHEISVPQLGTSDYVDPENVFSAFIRQLPKIQFRILDHIDPWGDTILNRQQCQYLLVDIQYLHEQVTDTRVQAALSEISALASYCSNTPHVYLRFIGD